MSNLLSSQPSLFLRQHADQPVHWMPWGKSAFDKAKREDKPIIVSIGYSSCHWCLTMAEESFDDEFIASIMNRHFVCIMVDREERPDVDLTYLEAIRMFDQSAGWPLNIFCLSDGRPFWGGTYFPKQDTGQGIVPWPQLLMRISEHYRRAKEELIDNAQNVLGNLEHSNNADLSPENLWNNALLLEAVHTICKSHDDASGGFSSAPKFPSPMKIDFLMAMGESAKIRSDSVMKERIDFCVNRTLEAMARGGLFDHVGGGFFRYAIDDDWEVPHFEKMLCDNALLLSTFSRAYRKYRLPLYRITVEKTIQWLLRELGSPEIGFSSSLSADSNGKEGGYYLWERDELEKIIGKPDTDRLFSSQQTNSQIDSDEYLPRMQGDAEDPKQEENMQKLLRARESRKWNTSRDEKRITAWNALLLKALVDAAIALNSKEYLTMASKLAYWMKEHLLDEEGNLLSLRYEDQPSENSAFLDDYAFWAEGLLALSSVSEWIEPASSGNYLKDAEHFALKAMDEFQDKESPGYFFGPKHLDCPPPTKKKFWYDNAIPSGNSSMLRVFASLYMLRGEVSWKKKYLEIRNAYSNLATKAPHGIGHALTAIAENEIGICSIKTGEKDFDELVKSLSTKPHRPIFLNKENETEEKSVLTVGTTSLPAFENCEELIRSLYDQ
jgi:uncharacterized protein